MHIGFSQMPFLCISPFFPEDVPKTYIVIAFPTAPRFPFHPFAVLITPRVNSSVREKPQIALCN